MAKRLKARFFSWAGPVLLVFLLLPFVVWAGSVVDTKHNMAYWSTAATVKATAASGESRVCRFCHTPHNAEPATPLWGHKLMDAGTTFKKYSSSTLQLLVDSNTRTSSGYATAGVTGVSRLCLGCHDGMTAVGALATPAGDQVVEMTVATLSGRPSGYGSGGVVDLSNKHPVSFLYDGTVVGDINAQKTNRYGLPDGSVTNSTVPNARVADRWNWAGKRVECTICHDPHTNRASDNMSSLPFWVTSSVFDGFDTYSSHDAVCISCHDKTFGEFTGFAEYSSIP